MRHAYGNANGDGHIHSDSDCNGNAYAKPDGNSHIYAYGDSDGNAYANTNCHSHCDCDRTAAAYTDATSPADSAASTVIC
jgi:hypothetical protein